MTHTPSFNMCSRACARSGRASASQDLLFLATGTELQNPNFAAMAEAVSVRGIRLEDPGEVDAGIAAALAHDGSVLVDAVVNRTELAIPPAVTMEMAKGFTLYTVKAVMSGRGDELIDLVKTNLWR